MILHAVTQNPSLRFIAGIVGMFFMMGLVGVVAVAGLIHYYNKDLPDYQQLSEYNPPIVTRLYAANGGLLAEYATQKRIFVPLNAIPKQLQHAFIAAEDKDFYEHPGVDIRGVARAVLENVKNYGTGRRLVGGSTITQQVVKNFLLTNEKSFERKIKEALLAFRISRAYSKEKILELYLNEIYLGRGSYGVAAAALNYFGKALNDLEVQEMAFLAALPQQPARLDPDKNYDDALTRRNYVLRRMHADGYIDAVALDKRLAEPITTGKMTHANLARGDFFAEEVRRTLAEQYGSDVLYKGGLTVHTTLQPELQQFAENALRKALIDYDKRHGYRGPVNAMASVDGWQKSVALMKNELTVPLYEKEDIAVVLSTSKDNAEIGLPNGEKGSIARSDTTWARKDLGNNKLGASIAKMSQVMEKGDVILVREKDADKNTFTLHQIPKVNGAMLVMEPHTGKVLAMVGGYSYQKSEFNRATQARRQPGSALKPFVYLTALENGFTPATIVMDGEIAIEQGPNKPLWKPQNYGGDFLGPTTLRMGLEKSRNTMTVRLAQMLSLNRVIRLVKRFGLYDDLPRNFSMVLGSQETTLLRLINAYSMFVNGGHEVSPALIERIDDREGKIVYRRDTRDCQKCQVDLTQPIVSPEPPLVPDNRPRIVDERVAYQIVSMLEGVVQRGTGVRARQIGKPVGGKTGTTNDSRDAWFVGFSPDLVAGVFIGHDTPKGLGDKETGGRVALPAFVNFMSSALKDQPERPFRIPPGIQQVRIERKTGIPAYSSYDPNAKIITESFITDYESLFRPESDGGDGIKADPPVIYADDEIEELWHAGDDYDFEYEDNGNYTVPPNPYVNERYGDYTGSQQPGSRAPQTGGAGGYPNDYDPRNQRLGVLNGEDERRVPQGNPSFQDNSENLYQLRQAEIDERERRDQQGNQYQGGTGGFY